MKLYFENIVLFQICLVLYNFLGFGENYQLF